MTFSRIEGRIGLVLLPLVLAAPGTAQDSVATAERKATTGVFSAKQAERGEGVYQTSCQSCHTRSEYTGDKFKVAWLSKSAFDVFDQIRTTMPEDNPGSLERQQYIDVVAYIFALNAYPAGADELPSDDDGLKKVRIDDPPGQFSATRPTTSRPFVHPRANFRK